MSQDFDDLPGCFGIGRPEPPNTCESCSVERLCKKVVENQKRRLGSATGKLSEAIALLEEAVRK